LTGSWVCDAYAIVMGIKCPRQQGKVLGQHVANGVTDMPVAGSRKVQAGHRDYHIPTEQY